MSDKLIVLLTIVIGHLTTGLSQPTATSERITSDGCGSTKVCAREDGCEPAGNVLCPFASIQVINNSTLDVAFELFGNSSGYIGLVLESDVIQGGNAVFVCSRNPNERNFFFRTAILRTLPSPTPDLIFKPEVDSVKYNFNGSFNSNFHQCSFTARGLRKFLKMTASGNVPVQLSIIRGEVTVSQTFQTPPTKLLDKTIHIPVAAGFSSLKHPLTQADRRFQDSVSKLFPNLDLSEIISNLDPSEIISNLDPSEIISNLAPSEILSNFDPSEIISNLDPCEVISNLDPSEIISNLAPSEIISYSDPCSPVSSLCSKATLPSYSMTQAMVILVSAFAFHLF